MNARSLLASFLHWRGLPLLVLLGAFGLTLAYWWHERQLDRQHLHASFDASLREASLRVEQRMAGYEHLLQGVQGFLLAAPLAAPQALQRYVDSLPLGADFVGLQGVALAPLLAHARRPAFEQRGTRLRPEGERSHYAPIGQIEPAVARNMATLGHDLLADPRQRRALELARDSGRLALSAHIDLAELGLPAGSGFLMVLPIYHGDERAQHSVQERRDALRAWVVAPVRVQDLMSGLYGELPAGLGLELHDGQTLDDGHLLYRAGALQDTALRGQEYLVLGGQTWTLTLRAGQAFAAINSAHGANAVLAAGTGFAFLLALLAWMQATARARAQRLAERMTGALRESEQRWAFALEGAGDGVWDWQVRSGAISTSARWKSIMGMRPGQAEPSVSGLLACTHADDMPRLHGELQHCLDGSSANLVSEYRVADGGGWRWVLARGTVIERDSQGLPLRMIGTLSDITARRESEERVRFMALHDPLTELANRAHFDERMHFALANARRYNESLGLILLDLDRFKPVNDQHGHAMGDLLLQTVAKRILYAVRETDTVGRIGGDEFVVLLTGPVTRESAQVVADKIFNQVAQPMELGGLRIEITCSLGLALYPDDGLDELTLTKAADDAMYRNKRTGKSAIGEARAPSPPSPPYGNPGGVTSS